MAQSTGMQSLIERHPLQRLNSPSRRASAILHLAGIVSFALSFKYLNDNPNVVNESYGWHFQYLTIIGLTMATLTFIFGSAADFTLSPRLFLIKNLLSVCGAPLAVLISILYWGLRAIDKKLVMPDFMKISTEADLGFHAVPAVLLTLDLLLFSPPWTISALPAMGLSSVIAFVYWFWIELCYSHNGWYPYPIFEMLNTPQRAGLFTASAALMTLSTITLQWLYGRINGFGTKQPPRAHPGAVKRS